MQVYISWSGSTSRAVGLLLRDWLPRVDITVDPWMSETDIARGGRWFEDNAEVLEQSNIGILCVTPTNIRAPWLFFEAGALSKSKKASRVCPVLWKAKPADLVPPLAQFQAVELSRRADVLNLVQSINQAGTRLPVSRIEESFDIRWPQLERELQALSDAPEMPHRTDREILEEILIAIRNPNHRRPAGAATFRNLSTFTLILPAHHHEDLMRIARELPDLESATSQSFGDQIDIRIHTKGLHDPMNLFAYITRRAKEDSILGDDFHL